MLGLAYLFVGGVYLAISVWVVLFAMRQAQKRGIEKWKWGVPAAFIMYLLVFWDHIPTVVAHQYYCHKDAGFTVYKTLEQWKQENPGVAEILTYEEKTKLEGDRDNYVFHLNQRFDSSYKTEPVFLSVVRFRNQIIDTKNNQVLAEYIDFRSGGGFQYANDLTDYKLWLAINACDKTMKNRTYFGEYLTAAERIGDIEK